MNSVSEKIDERILRLLSLEDIFDIDYDTYYTLIREAMVAGAKKLPEEELALLANERKRIRGKKGRFKPEKGKITADKVATTKFLKPAKKTLALPPAKISVSQEEGTGGGFVGIRKTLDSILKTLSSKFKFDQKQADQERKEEETQRRGKREEGLEGFKKGVAGIVSVTKKILSPFQSIIDRIWRFIFFTLLGRAFTQLMEWLGNPANKKKVEVLSRFLKDWWPTLLGAAILFFTPFGKFVRSTLKLVGFFAGRLVKAIPQIAKAIKGLGIFAAKNPLLTIGAVTGVSAAVGAAKERERMEQIAAKQGTTLPKRGQEKGFWETIGAGFGSLGQLGSSGMAGLAAGGSVPKLDDGYSGIDGSTGQKVSGFGADTQMIVAQPGEVVMNKKAVNAIGADTLLGWNRQFGGPGANSPKIGKLYSTGGEIERFQNGGIVGGIQNFIGGIGNLFTGQRAKATQSPIKTPKPTEIPDYQLPEAKALLKSIRTAEHYKGTKNPYNVLYGGGSAPITQMTVKEVINMYDTKKLPERLGGTPVKYGSGSGAVGAYQFMPFTLEDLIRRGEVKPNQIMTQQLQDKLGWALARNRGVNIQSLRRSGLSQSTLDKIAPEWASLPYSGAGGASYYGQPVKGADFLRQIYQQSLPKKQGGGLVENPTKLQLKLVNPGLPSLGGGGTDAITEQATDMPFGDRLKRFFFGEPKRKYDPQEYIGGGLIRENTGKNIRGATADRQFIAVQPGEFVIPKDSVDRLGTSFFEKLVAMTDSNSNPYLGKGTTRRPQITPYSSSTSGSGMMTLPPITQSAGGSRARSAGLAGGSEVPGFAARHPNGMHYKYAEIYGIGSMVG